MKVKIVNPENAAGLRDPHTKRQPFLDGERVILDAVDVPDDNFWNRRLRAGEVVRADATPTGNEPIAPLTTRATR
jgi:hypothetical protein